MKRENCEKCVTLQLKFKHILWECPPYNPTKVDRFMLFIYIINSDI